MQVAVEDTNNPLITLHSCSKLMAECVRLENALVIDNYSHSSLCNSSNVKFWHRLLVGC